ncbi:MAG: hypothetical protein ACREQ5_03450 [Candidatus Dormibacteria bacterium]
MKFHDSDPSVVWLAHAKAPVVGAELVDEQIRSCHRYYNRLIEIERRRREEYEAARRLLFPKFEPRQAEYDRCDAELSDVRAEIRALHAKNKSRKTPPEKTQLVNRLKEARAISSARLKALRLEASKSLELKRLAEDGDNKANGARKAARASCGIYWGSYLGVERAVDQARYSTKALPAFKPRSPGGTIGVQIQKGLAWSEIVGGDDLRVRFEPGPLIEGLGMRLGNDGNPLPLPSGKRKKLDGKLWVRIGSDGREPVWAVFPCRMYRIPPDDCLVKWVHVDRIQRANASIWQVRFTVARKAGWSKPCASSGTVGVDLGWRLRPDGSLRVAYWVGSDGRKGELCLPPAILQRKQTNEELRSIRDKNFDELKLVLKRWFLAQSSLPEFIAAPTPMVRGGVPVVDTDGKAATWPSVLAAIHLWRSPARTELLYHRWRANRFAGDDEGFRLLEWWRNGLPESMTQRGKHVPNEHGDLHLWRYECGTRIRMAKRRKNIYRCFARELARHYAVCHVEAIKMARLVRLPKPEEQAPSGAVIEYRRLAAVAELTDCLKHSGMAVEMMPAPNSTLTCPHCGFLNNWSDEDRAMLLVTCIGCGRETDQDESAALYFLGGGVASGEVAGSI